MKHFPKSVGQYLMTALITSTILEAYTLPLLGASSIKASSPQTVATSDVQTVDVQTSDVQTVDVQTVNAQTAKVQPGAEEIPLEVSPPETLSPQAGEPTLRVESNGQANQSGADQPQDAIASPQSVEQSPAIESNSSQPATNLAPPANAPPSNSPSNLPSNSPSGQAGSQSDSTRLTAARQAVFARLATLVNRDRLTKGTQLKETQLQQNLVALAFYYTQIGEFDDARQVARHPALSPELQATVLAEIDQIAADLSGQGATLTAQSPQPPAQSAVLQPDGKTAAPGSSVGVSEAAAPGTFPPGGYLTVPSTPDLLQPYLSDRCLNPASVASASSAPASSATGVSLSQFLLIGQQIAASFTVADRTEDKAVPGAGQKPPLIPITQKVVVAKTVSVSSTAQPLPASLTPNLPPQAQTQDQTQAKTPGLTSIEELAMLTAPPASTLTALRPVFDKWLYSTPDSVRSEPDSVRSETVAAPTQAVLPADAAPANQPQPSPTLIKLSRDATKASLSAQPSGSIRPAVKARQTVPKTSDYWRTIAANCGGMQTAQEASLDPGWGKRLASGGMIFPLPVAAALTSGFGWRIHPISGDRRFHSGIDLGAPSGTPVLSALAGRVVAAGDMGGYGLAVVVQADSAQQQNLYAHLSAIAVKPGDRVEQGSVLGLVGSTGNSTGPHLHFETLLSTTEGWTAVDPIAAATAASVAQAP